MRGRAPLTVVSTHFPSGESAYARPSPSRTAGEPSVRRM